MVSVGEGDGRFNEFLRCNSVHRLTLVPEYMRMTSDFKINCRAGEKQHQGYPPVWLKYNKREEA